jgi:hypothetical protein
VGSRFALGIPDASCASGCFQSQIHHLHRIMHGIVSRIAIVTLAAGIITGCATTPKPSKDIHEIMETGFKGKESLSARITGGQGSAADHKAMVDLTYQLTLNTPPKGDLKSWTEKTTALHAAAKGLAAGAPAALDTWKSAVNCKACHSVHKPD